MCAFRARYCAGFPLPREWRRGALLDPLRCRGRKRKRDSGFRRNDRKKGPEGQPPRNDRKKCRRRFLHSLESRNPAYKARLALLLRQAQAARCCNVRVPRSTCAGFLLSQEWRSVACARILDASPSNTRMLDSRPCSSQGQAPCGNGEKKRRRRLSHSLLRGNDGVEAREWRGRLYSLDARGVFAWPAAREWRERLPAPRGLAPPGNTAIGHYCLGLANPFSQ